MESKYRQATRLYEKQSRRTLHTTLFIAVMTALLLMIAMTTNLLITLNEISKTQRSLENNERLNHTQNCILSIPPSTRTQHDIEKCLNDNRTKP